MPLWRIRFTDRDGTARTLYCERDRAPGPDEVQNAMREHMLNLHRKKDAAPTVSAEVDDIIFQGMDRLPD